ncbi:MAG: RluA family pseudouridine synthase [Deltaproteobacteria bacterium]|nr:RluA family pseudouridine synthase [Deltaproteobacteria bacterium]
MRQHTVPPEAHGLRLDAFLVSVEPELSRSRLKALIESGEVTLDGRAAKPARLLKGGEQVQLAIQPPRPAIPQPEDIALAVLFEDSDLAVVDKPAGMVVHPGAGNPAGTLVNALLGHCRDLAGISGELRPGIVHRLDKDTSGCIVVAKNERTLTALQAQFKRRDVQKTYLALVHGAPPSRGRFETLHGRHSTDRRRFTGKVARGRTAITEWTVLQQLEGAALVQVSLLTGRSHQIRMHFSEAGHPLLGDALYGGTRRDSRLPPLAPARRAAQALGRQALHALRLSLVHPTTGERLACEAPLPADFRSALQELGGAGLPLSERVD